MRAFVLLGVCVCVWKQEPVSGRVDLVFVFFLIPPPYDYFNICPKKNVTRETFFSFFLSTNFDSDKGERHLFLFFLLFASSLLITLQPTNTQLNTYSAMSVSADKRKPVRIWVDGCFDLMHFGRSPSAKTANLLRSSSREE